MLNIEGYLGRGNWDTLTKLSLQQRDASCACGGFMTATVWQGRRITYLVATKSNKKKN